MLKLIKTDRRTNLDVSTLSDLLEINVEGPELKHFCAGKAIDMWWDDCSTTRRLNQSERKSCNKSSATSSSSTELEESTFSLDDWDTWMS